MAKYIKAYKVFDKEIKCRDFQFVPGKLHKLEDETNVIPCKSGFHACEKLIDCFQYKEFHLSVRVFEVVLSGNTVLEGNKWAASRIKLVRELLFYEIDELVNEGLYNLGYGNTGNWNTGNYNKGDYNTGDSNTGNWNKGDSNTGNYNKGNSNTGDWNKGNYNKGDWNTGDSNTGDYKDSTNGNT